MVQVIVLLLGVFASAVAGLSVEPNARTGCLPLVDNPSQSVEFLVFNSDSELRTFRSAKARCPEIGAGLTLARIDEANHFAVVGNTLQGIFANNVWLGVEAADPSKSSFRATDFVYSDGVTTHLSFLQVAVDGTFPWADREPNGMQENCGEIERDTRRINDNSCDRVRGFICRVDCLQAIPPSRSPTKSPTKKPTDAPSKSPTPKPRLPPGGTLSPSDVPTLFNSSGSGQEQVFERSFNIAKIATAAGASLLGVFAFLFIFALIRRRQFPSKPIFNVFDENGNGPNANQNEQSLDLVLNEGATMKGGPDSYSLNEILPKKQERVQNDLVTRVTAPVIISPAAAERHDTLLLTPSPSAKRLGSRVPQSFEQVMNPPNVQPTRHDTMLLTPTGSARRLSSRMPQSIDPVMSPPNVQPTQHDTMLLTPTPSARRLSSRMPLSMVQPAPPVEVTLLPNAKHRKKKSSEVNLNATPRNLSPDDGIDAANPSIAYLDAVTSMPGRPQSIFQPSTEYIDKATNSRRYTDISKKKKKSSRPIAVLDNIDLEL